MEVKPELVVSTVLRKREEAQKEASISFKFLVQGVLVM